MKKGMALKLFKLQEQLIVDTFSIETNPIWEKYKNRYFFPLANQKI